MSSPTVVCLTPVKDEEWILERYLAAVSLWADVIIVADQNSSDRSREIARSFPKVRLIENPNPQYNETDRQALLINAAREMVPGPRLLLALDADEAITGNWTTSPEWTQILAAEPGTSLRFHWANVKAGARQYWRSRGSSAWGFVDDGTPHQGEIIHSPRVPMKEDGPVLTCTELHFLHFQYIDPARVASKQRWYQCYERLRDPSQRPAALFDQYHHMHAVGAEELHPLPPEWLAPYQEAGIDFAQINEPPNGLYAWDPLVLEILQEHGMATFARDCLWDGWPETAARLQAPAAYARDPRRSSTRLLHSLLQATNKPKKGLVGRLLRSLCKRRGW